MASPLMVKNFLLSGFGADRRPRQFRQALREGDIARILRLVPQVGPPEDALLAAVDGLASSNRLGEIADLEPLVAQAPAPDRAMFRVLSAQIKDGDRAGVAEAEKQARDVALPKSFGRWAETWRVFLSLPQPDLASDGSHIPGPIIQFWDAEEPPRDIRPEMDRWARTAGERGYCRFSRESALEFLETHYGRTEILVFEEAPHPAVQSDLLRLWALRVLGGIYVDADAKMMPGFPRIAPAFDKPTLWFRTTHVHCRVQNGFLAFPPAHPFIDAMLETTMARMSRDPDQSILSLSGPAMATDTLLQEARAGRLQGFQALPRTMAADHVLRQIDASYKRDDRNWRRFQAKRDADLAGPPKSE